MRMKFLRKLLLVWMIAWLPAAGALAAVMPLSGPLGAVSASGAMPDDAQDMAAMPCHSGAKSGKIAFGQGCSHCVLCHLAGALVTPTLPVVAKFLPTHIYLAARLPIHLSFVPELISPPPRFVAV